MHLHPIRPTLSARLPSNPISNNRRRPKLHLKRRLLLTTTRHNLRNIEPPLSKLIIRARHTPSAKRDIRKSVQAVELQPSGAPPTARGVVPTRRRKSAQHGRVRPVVPDDPAEVEVVEVVVGIADDACGEEVEVGLAGQAGWDGDVESIVGERPGGFGEVGDVFG